LGRWWCPLAFGENLSCVCVAVCLCMVSF
jgi:hypothetical protein